MHLLPRRRTLWHGIPQLLLLLRMHRVMVRRPDRGRAGVTRVRILRAGLLLVVPHALLSGCTDHLNAGPLLEAPNDAGVDADCADEFDDGARGVEVVWGYVLLEHVEDLEDGHDEVYEEEEENSDG